MPPSSPPKARLDADRKKADTTDLAELVSAAEGLRARASGLGAVLVERARTIEHDRAATVDRDLVSSLEAEAVSLSEQLAETDLEAAGLLPMEAELETAEEGLAREAAELEEAFAERANSGRTGPGAAGRPDPTLGQRAGEVRAELSALRRATDQAEGELRRVTGRTEAAGARRARLEDEAGRSHEAIRHAEAMARPRAEAVEEAARQLRSAEADLAAAEESRRAADGARHRWSARVEALAQALDEARARAGARRLASVEGMLGALVELVDVDEGLEAAFEAAAGEALSAVLMDGEQAARRGLAHLAGQKAPGAVIALAVGGVPEVPGAGGALPGGATWLRARVRSVQAAVTWLLDRLLAGAVVVEGDWSAAVDVAIARPDLVVVTPAGDRCAGGIWRTGSHGTGATGAALDEALGAVRDATAAAERAALVERQAKGPRRGPRLGF